LNYLDDITKRKNIIPRILYHLRVQYETWGRNNFNKHLLEKLKGLFDELGDLKSTDETMKHSEVIALIAVL